MKFWLAGFLVACSACVAIEGTRISTPATMVRVVDGDTIVVRLDGAQERVRLIGMDTPERGDPFFREATAFLRDLLPEGTAVGLVRDVEERDRFGRLLAYVYLEEGAPPERMLNARIVAAGWARIMTIPPNVAHVDLFLRLQREARAAKRGMWATEPFE